MINSLCYHNVTIPITQMIAIAEHAEDNKRTLYRASTNLSSAIHLLNYLIKLTYDMSEDDFAVLQSILNPDVNDNGDQVGYCLGVFFLFSVWQM